MQKAWMPVTKKLPLHRKPILTLHTDGVQRVADSIQQLGEHMITRFTHAGRTLVRYNVVAWKDLDSPLPMLERRKIAKTIFEAHEKQKAEYEAKLAERNEKLRKKLEKQRVKVGKSKAKKS